MPYQRTAISSLFSLILLITLLLSAAVQTAAAQAEIENAFPNLSFSAITDLQAPPDGTSRLFAVERAGVIRVFENSPTASQTTTFLDISGRVDTGGEGGLLGLAFHPDHAQNGYIYVYYTVDSSPLRSVVARFTTSQDPDVADLSSEQVVLEVEQPYTNHNAGQLQFGPDGYLYVGLGDGGSGGDPEDNGQDGSTLLGSMLRLDVDLGGSGSAPDCGAGLNANYEVPADNPFVGENGACDEIYAYGLRNPYRYSFGPDGRLWVADVGQSSWEEIDWVEAGKNYGWNVMEGAHCYEPSSGCDQSGLELPVWEYSHSEGNSITGGYVYTGSCSYIDGQYIYGDYGNGRIWGLSYDASGAVENELIIDTGLSLTTFGVGPQDELYFAGIFDDAIHRFVCSTLPVELTAFTGRVDGTTVHLTWTTASETSNAGFEVQRETGGGFEPIGFVEGAGTSQQSQSYTFTVNDLARGPHRFRLKQVDYDGSASHSEIVEVNVPLGRAFEVTAPHPNPASTQAQFTIRVRDAQPVTATLYDAVGRRVKILYKGQVSPGRPEQITVGGSTLPSGRYLIRIEGRSFAVTRDLSLVR